MIDEEDQILLGWQMPGEIGKQIGYLTSRSNHKVEVPYYAPKETHLTTIARTGAGKGVSLVIPTLLSYRGSIICIDPKGENAAVTARYRRSIGQSVHILDPFGVTGQPSARLDPLDCLALPGSHIESDAEMLCDMVFPAEKVPRHAFWDNLGRDVTSGAIIHAATSPDASRRGIKGVYDLIAEDDFEMALASAIEFGSVRHPYARRAFAHFLELGRGSNNNNVKPDTLSTVRSHLAFLASEKVRSSMTDSTIDLNDLLEGKPTTIYLVLPPEYMESHARMLRLWIGTLSRVLMLRRGAASRVLMLLDEVAQLGTMPVLRQCITIARAYGVRVWMVWQNAAQLRLNYSDWETMLDNSPSLQVFGIDNHRLAREMADLMGIGDPRVLLDLPRDAALVTDGKGGTVRLRRLNYLTDPLFARRFDPNPYHTPPQERGAARQLALFSPSDEGEEGDRNGNVLPFPPPSGPGA